MLQKLTNVRVIKANMWLMLNMEALISRLEMKNKQLKDYIMLVPSLSLSKSFQVSKAILEESTVTKIVEQQQKMLIMQFLQLDMVLIKESISGMLKIHGEPVGESKDTLRYKEVPICVLLLNAIPILLLIAQMTLMFWENDLCDGLEHMNNKKFVGI